MRVSGRRITGMAVWTAGEQAGPRRDNVIRRTGPVMRVHERMLSHLGDPGHAEAVAAQHVVKVCERGVDGSTIGIEVVVHGEQQGLVPATPFDPHM